MVSHHSPDTDVVPNAVHYTSGGNGSDLPLEAELFIDAVGEILAIVSAFMGYDALDISSGVAEGEHYVLMHIPPSELKNFPFRRFGETLDQLEKLIFSNWKSGDQDDFVKKRFQSDNAIEYYIQTAEAMTPCFGLTQDLTSVIYYDTETHEIEIQKDFLIALAHAEQTTEFSMSR